MLTRDKPDEHADLVRRHQSVYRLAGSEYNLSSPRLLVNANLFLPLPSEWKQQFRFYCLSNDISESSSTLLLPPQMPVIIFFLRTSGLANQSQCSRRT